MQLTETVYGYQVNGYRLAELAGLPASTCVVHVQTVLTEPREFFMTVTVRPPSRADASSERQTYHVTATELAGYVCGTGKAVNVTGADPGNGYTFTVAVKAQN